MAVGELGTNWSGNYAYRAASLRRPQTLDELQELVAGARTVRALGTRHSFTAIADADELIALDRLPGAICVDRVAGTVSVPGHVTYAELAEALHPEGVALQNLASLPHISVAGAVATATHGSGNANGNLATAVRRLELVTASGELVTATAGDRDFDGMVVSLGSLGIVTQLTLSVEPDYTMRQRVYVGLGWEALLENLAQITATGASVSVFHRFGERTEQLWIKRRAGAGAFPDEMFGASAATAAMHPVLGGDPINCTQQLGVPGPWSERLPHFRSGFTPSSGDELQSEFFVSREDAVSAIEAVRTLAASIIPLLLVCELRTVAADTLWLSPQYERDALAIHFTWRRQPDAVTALLRRIEAALAPFAPRPHWGKVFTTRASAIAPEYERMDDFRALRRRLDPAGRFVNGWLRDRVLGTE